MIRFLALIMLLFATLGAAAQDAEVEEEKSRFTQFVEDQLSSDNMRIRLSGIEGALSSNARIARITVADRDGVWLTIEDARIAWSRAALLTGQLSISSLTARAIDMPRTPLPDEGAPAPEAGGFQVPQLPVSVQVDSLSVPRVAFGQPVFGLESVLSLDGSLSLAGGSFAAKLQVVRQDGPGGNLGLDATYNGAAETLDLDLTLAEPANGVLANLLSIHGRPPVRLAVNGAGPLGALDVRLALDATEQRVLEGLATFRRGADGLRLETSLGGPISQLIEPTFRPFFGERSDLRANALFRDGGGVTLDSLAIDSGALSLDASARTAADGFLDRLTLDGGLSDRFGRVVLPVAGGDTTVGSARLRLNYGETATGGWDGLLSVVDLKTGTFTAASVGLQLDGTISALDDPTNRAITFSLNGAAEGVASEDPAVTRALGDRIALQGGGNWRAGRPLNLESFRIDGETLALTLAGAFSAWTFDGNVAVAASSLAPFAAIAGRDLGGAADLTATGTISPLTGAFNLTVDGTAQDLRLGVGPLDNVLEGTTELSGRAERNLAGLVADDLRIVSAQAEVVADGRIASDAADFDFSVSVNDIADLTSQGSGRLTGKGRASGSGGPVDVRFDAALVDGMLAGRAAPSVTLGFAGILDEGVLTGKVAGNGTLDGDVVSLAANLVMDGDTRRLDDLVFTAGASRFTGAVTQGADGLFTGELDLSSPDIGAAAALALQDASGQLNARVTLAPLDGRQTATIDGSASGLTLAANSVGDATISARIDDVFGVPKVDGTFSGSRIMLGGLDIASFTGRAVAEGVETEFEVDATLANGAVAEAAGVLRDIDGGWDVELDLASIRQSPLSARLVDSTRLTVKGQTVSLDRMAIDVGGGRVTASGTAGDTFDLSLDITDLPLGIANLVRADLGLAGTVNGTARITGPRSTPKVDFDVRGAGISAAPLAGAGLPPLDVAAKGTSTAAGVDVDATVTGAGGISLAARGSVPFSGEGLDLAVDLRSFPLAVVRPLAQGQNPGGTVTGSARITGSLANPAATFDVSGSGLTASALDGTGLAPLSVSASGRFAERTVRIDRFAASGGSGFSASGRGTIPLQGSGLDVSVTLERFPLQAVGRFAPDQRPRGTITGSARTTGSLAAPQASFDLQATGVSVAALDSAGLAPLSGAASGTYSGETVALSRLAVSGPQDFTLTASGRIPLRGGTLSVQLDGSAPLSLANRFLAERGASASGTMEFSGGVGGTLSNPVPNVVVSTSGARFADPEANLALNNIALLASLQGDRAVVNRLSASVAGGGTVSGSGSVGLSGDLPSDLTIALDGVRYADGDLFVATVSGSLAVSGPLLRDPLVSGRIDVERAEIVVPENIAGAASLTDVTHRRAPPAVQQTLRRARVGEAPTPSARPSVVRLDITVNAPRRIFVRGRGLDAELGGSLRLTGPLTDIQPVGAFTLIRGRLNILTKRLNFEEGTVTLVGDLDPYLNFVATTSSGDTTVIISVTGRVSDLNIAFSSNPSLPEDEVLARLIFGRGITELSPIQIAQLAAAAAELAGGANTSLLDQLRGATGLDDLDVVTDSQGNAAVRAGRYIQDNIYLGVEAGAKGQTRATINLDITDELKAKGSVGSDGDSSVGVFFEKDY